MEIAFQTMRLTAAGICLQPVSGWIYVNEKFILLVP